MRSDRTGRETAYAAGAQNGRSSEEPALKSGVNGLPLRHLRPARNFEIP